MVGGGSSSVRVDSAVGLPGDGHGSLVVLRGHLLFRKVGHLTRGEVDEDAGQEGLLGLLPLPRYITRITPTPAQQDYQLHVSHGKHRFELQGDGRGTYGGRRPRRPETEGG